VAASRLKALECSGGNAGEQGGTFLPRYSLISSIYS